MTYMETKHSFTFLEANQREYREDQTQCNPWTIDTDMHDNPKKDDRSEIVWK